MFLAKLMMGGTGAIKFTKSTEMVMVTGEWLVKIDLHIPHLETAIGEVVQQVNYFHWVVKNITKNRRVTLMVNMSAAFKADLDDRF